MHNTFPRCSLLLLLVLAWLFVMIRGSDADDYDPEDSKGVVFAALSTDADVAVFGRHMPHTNKVNYLMTMSEECVEGGKVSFCVGSYGGKKSMWSVHV